MFKKRNVVNSVASLRKKNIDVRTAEQHDSGDSRSDSSSDDEDTHVVVKRLKKSSEPSAVESHKNSSMKVVDIGLVSYKSGINTTTTKADNHNEATKENVFYKIEKEEEEKRLAEKQEFAKKMDTITSDDAYRGDYNTYGVASKNEVTAAAKAKFGPMKASTNVRSTTVIDYQPDVCKDYKLTGYCGYGDNCKFLHSREDYKAGWQLDKDWEIGRRNESKVTDEDPAGKDGEKVKSSKLLEDVPFKCVICKDDYKSPVKTTCGHYFCEECFLKQHRLRPVCFICGENTGGIVKPAKELSELLKHRKIDGN